MTFTKVEKLENWIFRFVAVEPFVLLDCEQAMLQVSFEGHGELARRKKEEPRSRSKQYIPTRFPGVESNKRTSKLGTTED